MFRSKRTKRFRQLFDALPEDVQRQAEEAYRLFQQDPRHGSLHFKHVPTAGQAAYSAHVGEHYRVIGYLEGGYDLLGLDWHASSL